MPTLNVNRQGVGTGISNGNFNTARTNAASAVTDGITGEFDVQYFATGRTKRFKRVFLHFDTSGITGTVTAAHKDINRGSVAEADPNETIMIKSTSYARHGGTA